MRKPTWDEHLTMIFFRKFHRDIFAERRRVFAKIHSNIQHFSFHHPHELGLGIRRLLKMKSPYNAIRGFALVVLNKSHIYYRFFESLRIVRLEEVSPTVSEHPGLKHQHPFNICLYNIHYLSANLRRYCPYGFFAIGAAISFNLSAEIHP